MCYSLLEIEKLITFIFISKNDDTTEVRQRQRDSLLPGTSKELHQERKSLSFKDISSAEMFLHYSQCLKLSADNVRDFFPLFDCC